MNSQETFITNRNRIFWVDTAKALGLFFVFWGHLLYNGSPIGSVINRAIYSFHMPMYFILTGYVLNTNNKSFKNYIIQKFKRVLLPAIILYILTLPLYFFYKIDVSTTPLKSIISTVFYLFGKCAYNRPIWFFICLFQILVVAKLINLAEVSNKRLYVITLSCLSLSFLMDYWGWKYFNLLGFNKVVLGLFFCSYGLCLRRTNYERNIKKTGILSFPIWILSGIIFNTKCTMYSMHFGSFWLFIISGITGSLVFYSLCKFYENNLEIRQFSRWTIFIISSHFLFVSLFSNIALKVGIEKTYMFDITSAFFVLFMLLLYKPICRFIEKRLPLLIGYHYENSTTRNRTSS